MENLKDSNLSIGDKKDKVIALFEGPVWISAGNRELYFLTASQPPPSAGAGVVGRKRGSASVNTGCVYGRKTRTKERI